MNDWDYFDDIPEYHPIADANNLYDAFYKARKGSHWKNFKKEHNHRVWCRNDINRMEKRKIEDFLMLGCFIMETHENNSSTIIFLGGYGK